MTFNQWSARSAGDLPPSVLGSLEDIWNQIISAGNSGYAAGRMLDDAIHGLGEVYRERYRRNYW